MIIRDVKRMMNLAVVTIYHPGICLQGQKKTMKPQSRQPVSLRMRRLISFESQTSTSNHRNCLKILLC